MNEIQDMDWSDGRTCYTVQHNSGAIEGELKCTR